MRHEPVSIRALASVIFDNLTRDAPSSAATLNRLLNNLGPKALLPAGQGQLDLRQLLASSSCA
jgi:hypothetical protein